MTRQRITYGPEPTSYGELTVPGAGGPYPAVMMLHGGCWLSSRGAMEDYRLLAERLNADGIATWNVEYRRVGHEGGGWPGTFHDLSNALDFIISLAAEFPLDLSRIAGLGHSSGGHFMACLAARHLLPPESEIGGAAKARLAGVVLADAFIDPLVIDSRGVDGELYCDEPILERLLGGTPDQYPDRLKQVSPLEWLPWGIPQAYVVSSKRYPVEPFRPLADGRTTHPMPDYPALARAAGDEIDVTIVPGAGHFDFVEEQDTAGFTAARQAVGRLVSNLPG